MPIEVSLWERIGAFDPKSAESRERFAKFLVDQRARRDGTAPRSVTVDRLTKRETFDQLYLQNIYPQPRNLALVSTPEANVPQLDPVKNNLLALSLRAQDAFDAYLRGDEKGVNNALEAVRHERRTIYAALKARRKTAALRKQEAA